MIDVKLRAWNGEMLYIDDLYWFEEEGVHEIENGIGFGNHAIYNIMQFIGLKDINGKEIYDGDLVKYHKHVGAYYESKVVNKIGLVVWEEDKFSFRLKHNGGDSEKLFTSHRLEVIGNIYENPEILGMYPK